MVFGLILAIETVARYTESKGDGEPIRLFWHILQCDRADDWIVAAVLSSLASSSPAVTWRRSAEPGTAPARRGARTGVTRMSDAIEIGAVEKRFGHVSIIHDLNLSVAQGERHAIIGPNGAGKSTHLQSDQRLYHAELAATSA